MKSSQATARQRKVVKDSPSKDHINVFIAQIYDTDHARNLKEESKQQGTFFGTRLNLQQKENNKSVFAQRSQFSQMYSMTSPEAKPEAPKQRGKLNIPNLDMKLTELSNNRKEILVQQSHLSSVEEVSTARKVVERTGKSNQSVSLYNEDFKSQESIDRPKWPEFKGRKLVLRMPVTSQSKKFSNVT